MPFSSSSPSSSSSRSSSSSSARRIKPYVSDPRSDNNSRHDTSQADAADPPNESSPLLAPTWIEPEPIDDDLFLDRDPHDGPDSSDDEFQKTKSILYLILATIGIGGLQMAWASELSNGSPYLLSLGLSKSHLSLAWVAGPLTGTLVQPLVGMLSDNSRIRWGKRKPFILGGAVATVFFLLFLSWSKEIMAGFIRLFGADPTSKGGKVATIVVAVSCIYFLDVALNTVQATIRAFIVETSPSHQQEQVNSMASRLLGIGNIVGFLAGYIDLPKHLWWLGHTQFQILSALACFALCSTVLLSAIFVPERDPTKEPPTYKPRLGLVSFFTRIFSSIKHLPPQTRNVCIVQFCAWIGLFPPLFYTTAFVADLYVQPYLEENPHMTPAELDELYERATRVGTFALLLYSVTSLATNIILPSFIDPTFDNELIVSNTPDEAPGIINAHKSERRDSKRWLVIPGLTLKRAWMISHILFAASMFCAPFIRTVGAANAIIGIFGITWAMTLWAPWAIISAEISQRDLLIRTQKQRLLRAAAIDQEGEGSASAQGSRNDDAERLLQAEAESNETGVIMGIHNMAIAAPQFIATIVCSLVFGMSEKPRGVPGDRSIAISFAVGGFFVFLASFLVLRIRDDVPVGDTFATVELGGGGSRAGGGDDADKGTD